MMALSVTSPARAKASVMVMFLPASAPTAGNTALDVAISKTVFPAVGAEAGKNVTMTLAFARAGLVTLNAIIRDQRDDYAGITTGAKLATQATE